MSFCRMVDLIGLGVAKPLLVNRKKSGGDIIPATFCLRYGVGNY
jgi:hypothetical protein